MWEIILDDMPVTNQITIYTNPYKMNSITERRVLLSLSLWLSQMFIEDALSQNNHIAKFSIED